MGPASGIDGLSDGDSSELSLLQPPNMQAMQTNEIKNRCFIVFQILPTTSNLAIYYKRKCGDDFRLFVRRLWKDPNENKRYNAPHLYSVGIGIEYAIAPIHIQEMSAVRLSFHSENFHIF